MGSSSHRATTATERRVTQALATARSELARGRHAEAVETLKRALALAPNHSGLRMALADAYYLGGAVAAALPEYLRAAELSPNNVTAWTNAGAIFHQLGEPEKALGALHRALAVDPTHASALSNSGLAFCDTGEFALARECFDLALKVKPDYEAARWNRAILDLLHGDFVRGWEGHEFRHVQLARMGGLRKFPEPRWNGERFDGKRLLVWPEQGLGDQLQFIRFLPRVKALGGTVVLACAAPLEKLFRALVGDADEIAVIDTPYEACDLQVPLMSLPYVLGLCSELDAHRVPYLRAVGEVPPAIASATSNDGDAFRVGIVWAGQPKHQNDRNRSIALDTLAPLFDLSNVSWYSVQKGEAAEAQLSALNSERARSGSAEVVALGPTFNSFVDTAHALSQLDLVVTVDTAVAHLAGAMGIPVWVMLPFLPDWRWQVGRDDSPWYPSMRLFRQQTRGDWTSVVRRIQQELSLLVTMRARGGNRARNVA